MANYFLFSNTGRQGSTPSRETKGQAEMSWKAKAFQRRRSWKLVGRGRGRECSRMTATRIDRSHLKTKNGPVPEVREPGGPDLRCTGLGQGGHASPCQNLLPQSSKVNAGGSGRARPPLTKPAASE